MALIAPLRIFFSFCPILPVRFQLSQYIYLVWRYYYDYILKP